MATIFDLSRPWLTLDDWQKEYIFDPNPDQNNFILTGRQCGKTTAMALRSVELAVRHYKRGEAVLINSITEKQGFILLARALAYANEKYPAYIASGKLKPTKHEIHFKNGAAILCYAAGETGSGLRGFTIRKLMPDEASRMSEEYFVSCSPMLSVSHGSMDLGSTPCGAQGYFYERSKDNDFKKYFVSAENCPRHSKEFLAAERRRFTALRFAQEYEARFLDELKRVFSSQLIEECCVLERLGTPLFPSGTAFLGVDVGGMGADPSCFSSLDLKDGKFRQFDFEVTEKTFLADTAEKCREKDKKFHYSKMYIDDGGLGCGVLQILLRDDQTKRRVEAINNASRALNRDETEKKKILKEDLYTNLQWLMEDHKIKLFNIPEIKTSLASIQLEIDEETGKRKIWGSDAHAAESLIRAAWGINLNKRGLWVRC